MIATRSPGRTCSAGSDVPQYPTTSVQSTGCSITTSKAWPICASSQRSRGYSTLNAVFKELERHPNEKRILFHEVAKELRKQGSPPQRQRPKGKLAIIAKKKNRRVRRKLDPNGMTRNTEGHREMRLRCALGIPQLGDLIPDESAAERFIVKSRWPDGHVRCPRPDCSSDDVTEKSDDDRKTWR